VEIHGGSGIWEGNVRKMASHVARGSVEGAAQGNREVSEIAANPVSPEENIKR
jgi:hypothetical protein